MWPRDNSVASSGNRSKKMIRYFIDMIKALSNAPNRLVHNNKREKSHWEFKRREATGNTNFLPPRATFMFLFLCNFHETQAAIYLMSELVGSIGVRWCWQVVSTRRWREAIWFVVRSIDLWQAEQKKKKVDKFPSQEANIIITRSPHRKQYQSNFESSTDEYNNFFQGNWT